MMNIRLYCAAAALALVPSCDKARELAGKVKAAVQEEARSSPATDPLLAGLVDRTDEGAVFRNDLPFPQELDVRVTREMVLDEARIFQSSALGSESARISGTRLMVGFFERIGRHVRLTLETATFVPPEPGSGEDGSQASAPAAAEESAMAGLAVVFRDETGAWKPDAHPDFRADTWARELTPMFPQLIEDEGVAPRPQWLASRRIRPGEEISLDGRALAVLFGGATIGGVVLKLESFANDAQGHPCGVFSISGHYQRRGAATVDGEKRDEDVSIVSGEIWLSLVHPLVLREDLETIQTLVTGADGGSSARIQGKVRMKTTREWTVKEST